MRHALLAVVLLAGCPTGPVPPSPAGDGSAPSQDGSAPSCATWCDHARAMACLAGKPTPTGATCEAVCQNTLDGPTKFDVACRTSASTCESADRCEDAVPTRVGTTDAGPPDAGPQDAGRPDAQAELVTRPATCAGWCAHAADIGCRAAKPTPAGATCATVCANAQTGPEKWNLKCRATAKSCAAADACENAR